jgi:hypothetical protein
MLISTVAHALVTVTIAKNPDTFTLMRRWLGSTITISTVKRTYGFHIRTDICFSCSKASRFHRDLQIHFTYIIYWEAHWICLVLRSLCPNFFACTFSCISHFLIKVHAFLHIHTNIHTPTCFVINQRESASHFIVCIAMKTVELL